MRTTPLRPLLALVALVAACVSESPTSTEIPVQQAFQANTPGSSFVRVCKLAQAANQGLPDDGTLGQSFQFTTTATGGTVLEPQSSVVARTLRTYDPNADCALVWENPGVADDPHTRVEVTEAELPGFALNGVSALGLGLNGFLDVELNGRTAAVVPGTGAYLYFKNVATDEPPPPPEPCLECKGGIIELTLRNNGPEARIVVESESIIFDEVVPAGGEFTVHGDRDDGKLKKDIKIFRDGVEVAKIHTSCSKPIGPGAVFGDFEVVRSVSKDNGVVCPVPDCLECKGGVIRMTLRNDGPDAQIRLESETTVFDQFVPTGASFTVDGDRDDGKFKNDVKVFVDGVEGTQIHTSCSQPIGPGSQFGPLTVVEATSKDHGNICPILPPPPPDPDACAECKGGVVAMTLRYDGPDGQVVIESESVIFDQFLTTGTEISLVGDRDDGKFRNDVKVFVDGVEGTRIHTSCSQPIGPGAVFGDMTVISAVSRDNGNICPLTPPDDPGDPAGCQECKGGVVEMTLRNDGPGAQIRLESETVVFDAFVPAGGEFTVSGDRDDGKFRNDVKVFYDGVEGTRIHTSCSQPIGPGATFGDLTVVAATSRDNGEICPLPDCLECKGGILELTLLNHGAEAQVRIVSEGVVFDALVASGAEFTIQGDRSDGKFKNDIVVYVDGVEYTEIHTSCSQPIAPGTTFGVFEVTGAVSKDNGPVCPIGGATASATGTGDWILLDAGRWQAAFDGMRGLQQ